MMVLVVAHRGASAAHPPGNTVAALRAAGPLGADWVELDGRLTGDAVLVVHHDPALPDGRLVSELPAGELPSWVPTLGQAIEACAGLGLNVELKSDGNEDPGVLVEATLSGLGGLDRERLLVSSFDWGLLDALRGRAPDLPTGLLVVDPTSWLEPVVVAREGGHRTVNVGHGFVDLDLVTRAHDAGLGIHAWTVNDPDRMRELVRLGVDAVITDVPDVARAVIDDLGGSALNGG